MLEIFLTINFFTVLEIFLTLEVEGDKCCVLAGPLYRASV